MGKHTPEKVFGPDDLRKELLKAMPGYEWTVHRPIAKTGAYLEATGIQSSGFNRLSTLAVTRRDRDGVVEYEAKSAGFGKRAPWLHTNRDGTLARALRGLQQHYAAKAATYRGHAASLEIGRRAQGEGSE
ncbi:hypothetical protein E4M02_11000 [Brevundimonas sp. S30B]|uniref:hypothetical protein n=1 Tax=unclassified Brevundimonas TaxID=2622653 RepID=UPI0010719058|nr:MULTISPECIES: hypothetical protein [unclassified Brevundimonas]QBX38641.1 hypothetical protein E4M01_13260 [Brevundimonas sp. MF30-B]TFW01232.1 hypothetical protein E4M02_11000 [Brevundimonas sp. S30B]